MIRVWVIAPAASGIFGFAIAAIGLAFSNIRPEWG
jgi:hypothetical protein